MLDVQESLYQVITEWCEEHKLFIQVATSEEMLQLVRLEYVRHKQQDIKDGTQSPITYALAQMCKDFRTVVENKNQIKKELKWKTKVR